MPQQYEAIRDACVARKKKANGGEISDADLKACKKMAAIAYYKLTGKPVTHEDSKADASLSDPIDLEIMEEQIEIFGTIEEYLAWQPAEGENG